MVGVSGARRVGSGGWCEELEGDGAGLNDPVFGHELSDPVADAALVAEQDRLPGVVPAKRLSIHVSSTITSRLDVFVVRGRAAPVTEASLISDVG